MKNNYTLVLGCNGLIGRALIDSLIKSNHYVIGVDINANQNNLVNDKFIFLKKNLNGEKNIKNLFKYLINKKLQVDSFINLIYPKSPQWGKEFGNLKLRYINQDLSSQLGLQIFILQELLKYYLKLKIKGKVVLISSIQGLAAPKFSHYKSLNMTSPIEYSAIKAGIISITKYLAKKYKGYDLNINCVSPGGIFDNQSKLFISRYKKDTLNKGLLDPHDIIGTIKFLISNESKYINGQNIIIDDGWSL